MEEDDALKLCYVEGQRAWFTTQDLGKQWGDDWDDSPYEHNAGAPYEYWNNDRESGVEPWKIVSVYFDGPLHTPCEGFTNSPFSVQEINRGLSPWLFTKYGESKVVIPAGTTLRRFRELIAESGGSVYERREIA